MIQWTVKKNDVGKEIKSGSFLSLHIIEKKGGCHHPEVPWFYFLVGPVVVQVVVGCNPSLKRIQRYLGLVRHTRMSVRVFPERTGVGNTDCKANKPWMVTTFFSRQIPRQEEGKSKSDTMWAFKIPFCPEQHILLLLTSDSDLEVLQYDSMPTTVQRVFSVLEWGAGAPNFLDTEPLPL